MEADQRRRGDVALMDRRTLLGRMMVAAGTFCFSARPALVEARTVRSLPATLGFRARPDVSPVAATTTGRIRGFLDNGISVFKGVPYGADTSSRRFQPPVPPEPWTDVRDAFQFGHSAPQAKGAGNTLFPRDESPSMSEDCLALNLWTPALRDRGRRPVMVWFHPGGYSSMTSNAALYDGVRLCRRGNVVVVTVNHRLNAFGHLYLADADASRFADSGNAGMLDLVLALRWVRNNITEFGGDPNNVMIFGESGGGAKCATLMAMPAARGLFHRVATASGQQITASRTFTASANRAEFLAALRLAPDQIRELETMPMERLIEAARAVKYFGPVRDGRSLPRDPFDPDAPPLSADIPMLLGNNHDETRFLIGAGDPSLFALTWDTLQQRLEQNSPFMGTLDRAEVIAEYRRLYPHYSPSDVFFAATTASRSWRGQVIEAERRAKQPKGSAPTYVFQLDWRTPVEGGKWKACHGLDIPLVFDNVGYAAQMTGTGPDAQRVADQMSDAWIAFARTGKPGTARLPEWPPYDLAHRATMVFDLESKVIDDPRGAERRIFEKVPYVQPGT